MPRFADTGPVGGATVLVADMPSAPGAPFEGLQALLQSRAAADSAAVQLRLTGVRPAVQRLLERTEAVGLLRLYPSLDGAVDGDRRPASCTRPARVLVVTPVASSWFAPKRGRKRSGAVDNELTSKDHEVQQDRFALGPVRR